MVILTNPLFEQESIEKFQNSFLNSSHLLSKLSRRRQGHVGVELGNANSEVRHKQLSEKTIPALSG